MSDSLVRRIVHLEDDFLAAIKAGPPSLAAFNRDYLDLLRQLEQASAAGTLSAELRELARSSVACVGQHADMMCSLDAGYEDIVQSHVPNGDDDDDDDDDAQHLCPAASLPLFRYFLDNICSPYPDTREKERVAAAVRDSGWRDFDKKKFEDWLNRKRVQCGFVAILRTYCDGDRAAMHDLCRTALRGTDEQKACLPDGALEDVEDMRNLVQSQHDELIEGTDSAWVDELATGIRAVIDDDSTSDDDDRRSADDDYDSDSGSVSDWSETDVEDEEDEDEDEEPPRTVIGTKRKLIESSDLSSPVALRPLSRSFSSASSASSSTACSMRSFSASSISSTSDVEPEHDDMCDRPAKRSRRDSYGFNAQSMPSASHSEAVPTTTTPTANSLFTTYRTQRKRLDGGLYSRARSLKRSRYAALGVASQPSNVSEAHLASLSQLCALDWTPVDVVARDLDADSYTVDCTQLQYEASEDADTVDLEDEPAVDILTWSKLQIYAILRMLLSASNELLPASLAQPAAYAYAFDVDTFGTHNAIDLEEMMKLTPEALSAMFDAMNGLSSTEVPAEETVVPAAEAVVPAGETLVPAGTAVTLSDDALRSVGALSLTQEVSPAILVVPAPALDVLSPVLDDAGPASDVLVSAAEVSVLSIDTSAAALELPVSAVDEPLSTLEESLSPISSSSSEDGNPPALSDDSGSSRRSSFVESVTEQDSLLISPGALSADYSQLNEEMLPGKALITDSSQFQVEFGAVREVATADDLSCASELLERYLNDQMTWA